MKKIKIEHIDALSKGRKSGIHIGDRSTPHRLRPYERDIFELSLKRGYLTIDISTRSNLENLWFLVCQYRKIPCLLLFRNGVRGSVYSSHTLIFEGDLSDARHFLKKIISPLCH